MGALQNRLREISDRYRVDIIYSFGSRAHEVRDFLNGQGEWDKSITSDVDLGVKAAPDMASMSVREKVGLTADLEDLLGSKPERTRSHRPEPSGAPNGCRPGRRKGRPHPPVARADGSRASRAEGWSGTEGTARRLNRQGLFSPPQEGGSVVIRKGRHSRPGRPRRKR